MRHLLLASLSIALLAAACGGAAAPSDPPGSPPSSDPPAGTAPGGSIDATGEWRLVEGAVDGTAIPVDADWPVTFILDGTQVSGTSACNSYGGEIVVEDGEVRFGDMMMTMMACEEPAMSIEAAYHGALGRIRQASMEGETLVLVGDAVSLRFEPIPPVPTAELVDTDWILETIITGDVASSVAPGEPATLILHGDGRLEGFTGCRGFGGTYVEAGGEIVATELITDDRACLPPLDTQDGHVLMVLGDGFRVTVEGDRLTLSSVGGRGLVYVAAE